jgi:hypothetical protein
MFTTAYKEPGVDKTNQKTGINNNAGVNGLFSDCSHTAAEDITLPFYS